MNERQLIRAIYSLWDIQQALSALTFLMEDCDLDKQYSKVELRRFRCYESTVIISLARPFEASRNGTTLSLKNLGIKLNSSEKTLLKKIMRLRRKIFAHSDEEEMHFRVSTFPVLDGEFNCPHLQFNEGLSLEKAEHRELEKLLRMLHHKINEFFFQLAQEDPTALEKLQVPDSLKEKMSNQCVHSIAGSARSE